MTSKRSRKLSAREIPDSSGPPVSQEERLRALSASFSILGIRISMDEALALLKQVQLTAGEQNG
jgi:hypothetical protein